MLLLASFCSSLVLPLGNPKVATRPVDPSRSAAYRPVAEVCAACLFTPETKEDRAVLTATLCRDLSDRYSSRNRAENTLIVAEDTGDGGIVGSVGIEVSRLTRSALNQEQASADEWIESAEMRPLLSNLAVLRDYRRQGIAKRLCRDAEAAAKSWGYTEMMLKVEKGNRKALNLYRSLGYRVVATDRNAEKPVVSAAGGLRYVKTVNIAMRKDLRFPPVDSVLSAAAVLGLLGAAAPRYDALLQFVSSCVQGRAPDAPLAQFVLELLQGVVSIVTQAV